MAALNNFYLREWYFYYLQIVMHCSIHCSKGKIQNSLGNNNNIKKKKKKTPGNKI